MSGVNRPKALDGEHVASFVIPINSQFCQRVGVVTYVDGFQEVYVDDLEIGSSEACIGVAQALLAAAAEVHKSEQTARDKWVEAGKPRLGGLG